MDLFICPQCRGRHWHILLCIVAMLFTTGFAAIPAQAGQFTQQGNKLVGTGAVGAAGQGVSVAVSADGNTAIVGGYEDNSVAGAAWVFTRDSSGTWTQQGNKLVGSGAVNGTDPVNQGASVALSSDGSTAIVGGLGDNSVAGAAWVFTRDSNGTWTQQGNKLVGTGAATAAQQGMSVALSSDGNTAIAGGPLDGSGFGAAWAFTRNSNGVWTQKGNKLVGTGASGTPNQGQSVALSSDGNTAIVGGYEDNSGAGAAWVFGQPGVTRIKPNVDTVGGGTRVVIFGTNLLHVTGVTFGGVAATHVRSTDHETVRATTPANAAGKMHVVVSTRKSGVARLKRGFSYAAHATVTLLTSSVDPSTVGQKVRFKALVYGDSMMASGKVTFKDGTQKLGTVSLRNGVATFATTALAAGTHRIKAVFRGNRTFGASKGVLKQRVRRTNDGARVFGMR